jgi:hypothetical protein
MFEKINARRRRLWGKVRLGVERLEDRFVPSGSSHSSAALPPVSDDAAGQVVLEGSDTGQSASDASHELGGQSVESQPSGTPGGSGSSQGGGGSSQGGGGPTMVTISGPGYPQVPSAGTGTVNPPAVPVLVPVQRTGDPPSLALSPVLVSTPPASGPSTSVPAATAHAAKPHPALVSFHLPHQRVATAVRQTGVRTP